MPTARIGYGRPSVTGPGEPDHRARKPDRKPEASIGRERQPEGAHAGAGARRQQQAGADHQRHQRDQGEIRAGDPGLLTPTAGEDRPRRAPPPPPDGAPRSYARSAPAQPRSARKSRTADARSAISSTRMPLQMQPAASATASALCDPVNAAAASAPDAHSSMPPAKSSPRWYICPTSAIAAPKMIEPTPTRQVGEVVALGAIEHRRRRHRRRQFRQAEWRSATAERCRPVGGDEGEEGGGDQQSADDADHGGDGDAFRHRPQRRADGVGRLRRQQALAPATAPDRPPAAAR